MFGFSVKITPAPKPAPRYRTADEKMPFICLFGASSALGLMVTCIVGASIAITRAVDGYFGWLEGLSLLSVAFLCAIAVFAWLDSK